LLIGADKLSAFNAQDANVNNAAAKVAGAGRFDINDSQRENLQMGPWPNYTRNQPESKRQASPCYNAARSEGWLRKNYGGEQK
jgi:hypothetical protein